MTEEAPRGLVIGFANGRLMIEDDALSAEEVVPFQFTEQVLAGPPSWRLRRSMSPTGHWAAFPEASIAQGGYRTLPDGIELHPDTNEQGALMALRGLFSRAIERQGGILVHASCVSWSGDAALITGVSGAGKSTLARWSVRAGATLLSDEVVGLLPDGTVLGTPFRSDPDLDGTPTSAALRLVTTLRHGVKEVFENLPAHALASALCEQAFHWDGELSAAQVLRCVAGALKGARTTRFTCRNAPSSGRVLRQALTEPAPSAGG